MCTREDQLRSISKVREGMFNVIARFLRLNSILSYRVCLGPTVDTRACVRSGRLLTICEYISCHCKRCARAPWFWSSCLPACGLHEIGSVSVFAFFSVRKRLLGGCTGRWLQDIVFVFPSVYVSRGRSWLASPDEYRLCTSKSIPKPSFVVIHLECPGSTADTNSASVYGAFEEAQTASAW